MLNLEIPSAVLTYYKRLGVKDRLLEDSLRGTLEYLVDYCVVLKCPGIEIDISDYHIPAMDTVIMNLPELEEIIAWYSKFALEQMTLAGIDNPYLVDVTVTSFNITNKREYSLGNNTTTTI